MKRLLSLWCCGNSEAGGQVWKPVVRVREEEKEAQREEPWKWNCRVCVTHLPKRPVTAWFRLDKPALLGTALSASMEHQCTCLTFLCITSLGRWPSSPTVCRKQMFSAGVWYRHIHVRISDRSLTKEKSRIGKAAEVWGNLPLWRRMSVQASLFLVCIFAVALSSCFHSIDGAYPCVSFL